MPGPIAKVGLSQKVLNYIRDPAVAVWRKAAGLAAAVYVISPIDFVPDVFPVVGWLDDFGIIGAFAWFMVREIKKHAKQRELLLQQGPPKPGEP